MPDTPLLSQSDLMAYEIFDLPFYYKRHISHIRATANQKIASENQRLSRFSIRSDLSILWAEYRNNIPCLQATIQPAVFALSQLNIVYFDVQVCSCPDQSEQARVFPPPLSALDTSLQPRKPKHDLEGLSRNPDIELVGILNPGAWIRLIFHKPGRVTAKHCPTMVEPYRPSENRAGKGGQRSKR